ncbi:MAG: hypothetical protein WBP59_09075 [Ilumatobacteraceae bacterium]
MTNTPMTSTTHTPITNLRGTLDAPCFTTRLDAEWNHLRTSRRALRQARTWAADEPAHPLRRVAADVDDLGVIITATQRGRSSLTDIDTMLLRLIEIARDDELAGRLLVQRLLPPLISRAQPYLPYHRTVDPIELVVAAAWLAIRQYDTERRRRHVAASLLSDAIFQAFRRHLRRRSASETVRPAQHFSRLATAETPITALEELADIVRVARQAGVPTRDLDLVRHLVREGSLDVVARQRNVTPRTIRNHRDRAVANIRDALASAA